MTAPRRPASDARGTSVRSASAPRPRRGSVALVFEDVAGTHPAEPWRDDELARLLAAMAELAALLTPSPIRTRTAGDLDVQPDDRDDDFDE